MQTNILARFDSLHRIHCWHESGLIFTTHSGLSSFHFSLRIEHSRLIRNEILVRYHVNLKKSINARGRNVDCLQNRKFHSRTWENQRKNKMIGKKSRTIFNPEWDFDSPHSFNTQLNLSCKHGLKCLVWSVIQDWNSFRINVD